MLRIFVNTNFHESAILRYFASTYICKSIIFSFLWILIFAHRTSSNFSRGLNFANLTKIREIRKLILAKINPIKVFLKISHKVYFRIIEGVLSSRFNRFIIVCNYLNYVLKLSLHFKFLFTDNLPKDMAKVTHTMTLKSLPRNDLTYTRLQEFFEAATYLDFSTN